MAAVAGSQSWSLQSHDRPVRAYSANGAYSEDWVLPAPRTVDRFVSERRGASNDPACDADGDGKAGQRDPRLTRTHRVCAWLEDAAPSDHRLGEMPPAQPVE